MVADETRGLEELALLDVGIGVFDEFSRLVYCNPAFRALRRYPEEICREGVTLEALLRFNAERGDFGPGDVDAQVVERMHEVEQSQEREIEREMADGQILRIRYRRTASGGLLITFEDRTGERRAQAALAASEERYALVAEAAEEAIYEWEIDSGRFYASPRLKALIGREWGEDGARPWDWEEIIHPDDRAHYRDCLERHLSGEDARWDCEYRIEDATGALRWVSDHGTSIRGKDGRATRMVAAVRDITERVEKDAALAASEERHILVTRATSDGIYDWNVTDDVLYVSENLTRLLDFDLGNKASSTWAERVHEEDYPGYLAAIRAHFKGEAEGVDCEYRVRARGGGYRWVHDRGVGVRNDAGRVTRLVGAVRDITDIKEAKAELDRTEARLVASLATISDGILLVDGENRVQLWNERYYEIFSEAAGGADLSEVIVKGRDFFDMIRDGYRLGMFKPHEGGVDAWVRERRTAWERPVSQWELELANGTWILLNERRMPDGGRVSVYTDITDLKAREAEAQAARQRFEEAIEAISTGFALFDAEDRLVVWNSRFRDYFSEMADVFTPGARFRDMLAASIQRGLFPSAEKDPDAFLERILAQRAEGMGKVRENRLKDGRWLQITDHRTKEGGVVSIYTDVTRLKTSEQDAQAARQRFEEAIGAIASGFVLWDAEDRIVTCNARFREFYAGLEHLIRPGNAYRDLIDAAMAKGLFPDAARDPENVLEPSLAIRARGEGIVREQHLGDGRWLQITDHRTGDGGLVSIYTDITELKLREQEAQAARERFEEAIEAISSGFALWDAEDRLVVCNGRYRHYFAGFADRVAPGVSFRELIFTAINRGMFPGVTNAEEFLATVLDKRAQSTGAPREQHLSDGTWLQITDHRTTEGGIVSIYTDVTELKTRQAEAQAARQRFEEAIEAISSGFSLWDAEDRLVILNSRYRELYQELADIVQPGIRFRDVVSKAIERGLIPAATDDPEAYLEEHARRREEGVGQLREHRMAGGLWLQITDHRTADGGIVSIHTDVTELKNREEELRQKSAILEQTLENMGQGISLVDKDLRTLAFNKKFFELLELPEDRFGHGFTMEEAFRFNAERGEYGPGDVEEQVRERVELAAKFLPHRFERIRPDGTVIEIVGNPMEGGGFVSTYTDITERKQREAEITRARDAAEAALADLQKAQARLVQAEKMASLGQLTAGIAHEIKNPLNFVNNFSKLSDEMVGELTEILETPLAALDAESRDEAEDLLRTVRENLAKIAQHGKRADSIVKNMLMHAREGPSERQTVGLNAIAEEALNLAYHGARAEHPGFNIEMVRELDPEVGEVECYPQDLMRVFLNLISNGMYAADRRSAEAGAGFSPTISLTTRANGEQVEVEVRDNGVGIPPELRERIFMPFFTTKPAGEGTGLGLSLSYDIVVKQHGGDIEVESEPGAFTAFRVTLPRRFAESDGEGR